MRSPYAVLGVPRNAEPGTIKSAYRSLAKTWHPDQNQHDPLAGSRFAEITHAYQILTDPEMRQRFDRGDIDTRGRKRGNKAGPKDDPFATFRNAWRKRPQPAASPENGGAYDDLAGFDAMIKHIFGDHAEASHCAQAGEAARNADPLAALDELFAKWKNIHRAKPEPAEPAPQNRMPDERLILDLDLEKVLSGGSADIRLSDGTIARIAVPAGIADGAEIRHEERRDKGVFTALVTVRHRPHRVFRSEGRDLHMDHAIELSQAVLGGHAIIDTLDGSARVPLGAWTTGGAPAVIEGKGLPGPDGARGDLHVHFRIRLPGKPDPQLMDMMRSKRKSVYM